MSSLRVQQLNKTFGSGETAVHAIQDVSAEVAAGEIVLIMGPSGSGKTTLLSMIGGLLTPTSGIIEVNDREIQNVSRRELSRMRLTEIGFVFQSFNMLENLSALENVQIVGHIAGMSPMVAKERATALLTKLHMERRLAHKPAELSGGQQQRVAIARALLNSPGLILADEPTGNLDSQSGHEVMMLFHNIAKEEGRAVVIVSHDERIKDIADRVLWIEDGSVSEAPPDPEQTAKDPVCGMHVDARYAPFKKKIEGETYRFCSQDCERKFVEHPYQYVSSLVQNGE